MPKRPFAHQDAGDVEAVAGPQQRRRPPRAVTVYDAVAGRVGYEGFLSQQTTGDDGHRRTGKYKASGVSVPPDEVLFRRAGAPERYQEDDIYFANRRLPPTPNHRLPDSDLLKTLHAYCADYYGSAAQSGPHGDATEADFRSMDETALIALGILMEEAANDAVGATGDLALVERDETVKRPRRGVESSEKPSVIDRPAKRKRKSG